MKRIPVITILSVLSAVTAWRLTCPALLRVRTSIMAGSPHLLVLNPIRSWAANRAADSLLEFLRSGDASGAANRFPMIGKSVIEENMFPLIRRWALDDVVVDGKGEISFEYMYSDGHGRNGGYMWVYCVKGIDGAWTVRTFNRVS